MPIFRLIISACCLILVLWAFNRSWGTVPALGPLLNPAGGIWQNTAPDPEPGGEIHLQGLKSTVVIRFDERRVPHIFAENDHDLYFAQGYVMARDRLWQMDFMTRAAAGRLSEVLGDRAFEFDLNQRRLGVPRAAQAWTEFVNRNDTTRTVNEAFAAGVNAWIAQLAKSDYPMEYKMLEYEPEPWSVLKTALMFMNIRQDLSGSSNEHRMLQTRLLKGEAFVDHFLGNVQDWVDPIIPKNTPWNFEPISVSAPDSLYIPAYLTESPPFESDPANGSNNWAVSGSKTASGSPLLSNDPHLGLKLPSIWYESQLVAPGVNVYGVSLAGTPGITIGFNEDVAWGLTNTGSDVFDWYEIAWKDSSRSAYRFDGGWREAEHVTEVIAIKGKPGHTEIIPYTHHGPVSPMQSRTLSGDAAEADFALRWAAHEVSNEMLTIYLMNRASGRESFMQAVRHFRAPAQNVVYATRAGDIGIISNGALPVKWEGQGKYPGDGSDPRYDWHSFIPFEQLPQIHNPGRGFVSSANQHPADPSSYPYYLDASFAGYERGARINERLTAMQAATPDSMIHLLNDNLSLHAQSILPRMLQAIEHWQADSLDTKPQRQLLSAWNYYYDADAGAGALFQRWWSGLHAAIWEDEFPSGTSAVRPSRDRTVKYILEEEDGEWTDDERTPEIETMDDLIRRSFVQAVRQVKRSQGDDVSRWTWTAAQNGNLSHLLNLESLAVRGLEAGGCSECVNAFSGGHGPSWKMVVSLEDPVQAWGVFPGGPSGNPASPYFTSSVQTWTAGKLYALHILKHADDKPETVSATLLLRP